MLQSRVGNGRRAEVQELELGHTVEMYQSRIGQLGVVEVEPLEVHEAGKLRHYGVSVEKVEEALKAIEYPNVQSVQIIFNLFRQRPADLFFRLAQEKKVGILARVPLASGMLTGKMTRQSTFATDDHRNFNRHGEAFDVGETFSGVDYETGLDAVDEDHPFCNINLTDNIVQFETERYSANPLVIQGPGAGPAVTAAGVFSDARIPPNRYG